MKILEEFKGLKEIAGIRANGKRAIIGSIQAKDGSIKQERQDIADTFAEFYEDLYTAVQEATHSTEEIGGGLGDHQHEVPDISAEEVQEQIKRLEKGQI